MMKRIVLIIFLSALLLFSCFGKKNNNNVSELPVVGNQRNSEETTPHTLGGPPSIEEAKNIIQKNERIIIEEGAEIVFIERANFGIPGGGNWIVILNDSSLIFPSITPETENGFSTHGTMDKGSI